MTHDRTPPNRCTRACEGGHSSPPAGRALIEARHAVSPSRGGRGFVSLLRRGGTAGRRRSAARTANRAGATEGGSPHAVRAPPGDPPSLARLSPQPHRHIRPDANTPGEGG